MIEVENLTKYYGPQMAIEDVNFRVEKGEILGFLGPNAAGKTTTMRILTCYMPATKGTARVAGYDIFEDSLQVKKRIGYLPENPPLYTDMSVSSYLGFVSKIKGIEPHQRERRMQKAMERYSITEVKDTVIGRLSNGYQQRVGLAQALIHDPEVLLLDEPTVGLNPKQIIEVRERYLKCFNNCDLARFSPSGVSSGEMEETLRLAQEAILALEKATNQGGKNG